jgi:hypothetical protein
MITTEQDVAILVVSCDAYQDLWGPFFQFFFQYWPDCPYPVFLGSNSLRFDDGRVSAICVGPDTNYSSNLLAMLAQIKQEWVLIFVEDVFLTSVVATKRIKEFVAFCQRDGGVHLQLLQRRFNPHYLLAVSNQRSEEAIELPVDVPYRASLNVCLWNKSTLWEILRPGESAWEFERQGTVRSFKSSGRFLLVSENNPSPPFLWIHGVIKRKWTRAVVRFLRRQEYKVDYTQRSIQSFGSYVYLMIYTVLRYCAFWFMYKVYGPPGMMKLVYKHK